MKSKNKTPLPLPVKLFCVSLLLGILYSFGSVYQYIEVYNALLFTAYDWVAALDLILLAAHLLLSISMLLRIHSRSRVFLVYFWIDFALKVISFLAILSLAGSVVSSLMTLFISVLWACYFHLSAKVAAAFSLKRALSGAGTTPPADPTRQEHARQFDTVPKDETSNTPPHPHAASPEMEPARTVQSPAPQPSTAKSQCAARIGAGPSMSGSPAAPQSPGSVQNPAPASVQPVSAQRRFCRYCGSMYGPNDSHCPGCGRRVRLVLKIPFDFSFSSPPSPPLSSSPVSSASSSQKRGSFSRSRSFVACLLFAVLTFSGVLALTALWEFRALESSSGSQLYQVSISIENSKPQGAKEYHDEISLDGEVILEDGTIFSLPIDNAKHEIRFSSEQTLTPDSHPDKGVGFYILSPSASYPRELSFECSAGMKEWLHGSSGTSRYIDSYTRTATIFLSAVLPAETAQQISFVRNAGLILSLLLTMLFFVFAYRRFRRKR